MKRLKRLVCIFLRHKWEYLLRPRWTGKARGCLRCDKREAQINPNYWHHIDWDWVEFKKLERQFEQQREMRKGETCKKCLRWEDGKCTEITMDTYQIFPNCFLRKD